MPNTKKLIEKFPCWW